MLKPNSEVIIFFGCASVFSALVFSNVKKRLLLFQPSCNAHLLSNCFEAHLFAFVRKMPSISTRVGGVLCLLMLDWRSAVGQMLCLGITCVVLASTSFCVLSIYVMTLAKYGPICDIWILFKPEFQALFLMDLLQMFSVLTGWYPAVTDGGRSGPNQAISGPSLCFSELRPQWRGLLFSVVL